MKSVHSLLSSALLGAVMAQGCSGGSELAIQESAQTQGYTAEVWTDPSPLLPGSSASLEVVIAKDGTQVTAFDDLHTQLVHMVAVSSDLNDFLHIHPDLGSDGVFRVDAEFVAQPYSVFFEFDPAGPDEAQLARTKVTPEGAQTITPILDAGPIFTGEQTLLSTVQSTEVSLSRGDSNAALRGGEPAHLVFSLTDSLGLPVDDLQNWLGMPGHAIVLSKDKKTFLHLHGQAMGGMGGMAPGGEHSDHGTEASPAVSTIGFDVTFPKGGSYRIFGQFKRGNTVLTVPFDVKVKKKASTPAPGPIDNGGTGDGGAAPGDHGGH